MTTAKPKKTRFQNHDGEIFDPESAIKRHHTLTTLDVAVEVSPSYGLEFTMKATGATMARLCQILNSAPVNGDPLRAIVNLDLDTTANEARREALVDYLGAVEQEPTLGNVAAAYLHEATTDQPLELDVHIGDSTQKYAVTRVSSRHDDKFARLSYNGACISSVTIQIPAEPTYPGPKEVTFITETGPICIEGLEGRTLGDKWRIIHALEPAGQAPHGGFILERIEEE